MILGNNVKFFFKFVERIFFDLYLVKKWKLIYYVNRVENYNILVVEFLRRFFGVLDVNYRSIMEKCKSLFELVFLFVEELVEIMGG